MHIDEATAGALIALQARLGLRIRLRYTPPQTSRLEDFERLVAEGIEPCAAARCVMEQAP